MTAEADTKRILNYLEEGTIGVKDYPGFDGVKHFTFSNTSSLILWDIIFLCSIWIYLGFFYLPEVMFSSTITSGGDTLSHYFTADFLTNTLLPQGKISGWCHGNLGGFPMLQYYFPVPFLLMAGLSTILGMPLAFKFVTALGVFLLPLSLYAFFRFLRQPFPVPIIGAVFSLVFLFNEGNKMWGGNIPSTLAGEFCYSIGFSLAVLWLGLAYRTLESPTRKRIVMSSALLALVGLSHAYALLFAGFGSGFFLFTRIRFRSHLNTLIKVHALAFCLLGFWIMPLMANLPWTTKFNILWIFHSWEQALEEIFPTAMWPFMVLTGLGTLVFLISLVFSKRNDSENPPPRPFCLEPMAYVWGLVLCGVALYFAGYRARVVDVRFIPFFQLFLITGGALVFSKAIFTRNSRLVAVLLAALVVTSTLLWVDGKVTYIGDWVKSSYQGAEAKPLWKAFKSVNDHLAGDADDPRVMYEHSTIHQGAGSVRAYENLPLFSGRSTLECVYIQAAVPAPFVFYIQSETCQRPSTPIPEVFFSRFDIKRGVEHMKYFNVSQFIAVEGATKQAIDESQLFILEHMAPPYRVYGIKDAPDSYVKELDFKPVLLPVEGWVQNAYTWFRLGNLDVAPVFADGLSEEERGLFTPAGKAEMRSLPRVPLPSSSGPELKAMLEHEKITITGAVPGKPLLVKASFHPGWKASGGERIFLAGPGFMLLFPQSPDVVLEYGPTRWDWVGKGLTAGVILWVILCFAPFSRGLAARVGSGFDRYAIFVAVPLLCLMGLGVGLFLSKEAPEFPAVPYNEGLAYFAAGDYDEAAKVFEYMLDKHGQSLVAGESAYHLAMCAFRQKDFANCIRSLERTLHLYPETQRAAEIHYHLGLCKMELQRYGQARQAFDRTVEEFPHSTWAKLAAYHHAMTLFRTRDFSSALASLDRLLALAPDRLMAAEAWFHKGLCHAESGNTVPARRAFNHVMGNFSDTVWAEHAGFHYGLSFFKIQDFDNTARAMKQLLGRHPQSRLVPEALYHLGLAHKFLGDTEQAARDFKSLVVRYPGSPFAGHAKDRLKELGS